MKRRRRDAHIAYLMALDAKADRKQELILREIARRADGIDNDQATRERFVRQAEEDRLALCSDPSLDELIEIHNRSKRACRYFLAHTSPEEKERMLRDQAEYDDLADRIRALTRKLIEQQIMEEVGGWRH